MEDTRVDEPASEALRAEIRRRRIAELGDTGYDHTPRELPVLRHWSDVIKLVRDGDEILVQAAASGAILGPLGRNSRACAPYRVVQAEELGPLIRVHEDLEPRQYVDPITGRSLIVDFVRPTDEPLVDFELRDPEL